MFIKIAAILFALYNIYKSILRLKDGEFTILWFIFWNIIWTTLIVVTLLPWTSDKIAHFVGFGASGIQLIVYVTLLFLVYAVYRLMIKMMHYEYEITQIVRNQILEQAKQHKSHDNE